MKYLTLVFAMIGLVTFSFINTAQALDETFVPGTVCQAMWGDRVQDIHYSWGSVTNTNDYWANWVTCPLSTQGYHELTYVKVTGENTESNQDRILYWKSRWGTSGGTISDSQDREGRWTFELDENDLPNNVRGYAFGLQILLPKMSGGNSYVHRIYYIEE
jgi:hypothetical protein